MTKTELVEIYEAHRFLIASGHEADQWMGGPRDIVGPDGQRWHTVTDAKFFLAVPAKDGEMWFRLADISFPGGKMHKFFETADGPGAETTLQRLMTFVGQNDTGYFLQKSIDTKKARRILRYFAFEEYTQPLILSLCGMAVRFSCQSFVLHAAPCTEQTTEEFTP